MGVFYCPGPGPDHLPQPARFPVRCEAAQGDGTRAVVMAPAVARAGEIRDKRQQYRVMQQ
jgi:hypothetical protein